ncbi:hypothetical protein HMPREF0866_02190 [Ruminococcaceae bacterium D16]|nr:hypothetical protein HMPREF0866_02190 [Ruminococcaceae bacterium D16]
MRNLKRALSLLLSSTMVLGMLVMGSSAASYTDVTSEENVEAIEVLKAVGVMTGDENGNFNPDKLVTRAEMAVVMANLLDLKVEDFKGASIPFTDVPEWAVPYVAACYADGITAGISATQYGSNDSVTTAQAALMMMKALGYFQNASDFGSDWQVATVKQGSKINLFDGVEAGASSAMTRNEVAQIALNTLKSTMVETDGTNTTITTGDVTINTGDTKYVEVTNTSSKYAAIDNAKDGDKYYVQLGEKLYDGDLKLNKDATDAFGRPGSKWTYNNDTVGTYSDEADATYTASVKSKEIYSDLGLSETTTASVIVDGEPAGTFSIAKSSSTTFGKSGNGVLVEAYVDDDDNVTLVAINTYVGEVTSVYEDADEPYSVISGIGDNSNGGQYETTAFDEDDIVLYTYADGEIQSVALADKVEGAEVSSTTKDNSKYTALKADGTSYDMAAGYELDGDLSGTISTETSYDLYLDAYGYVIYVGYYEAASSNYAYVLRAKQMEDDWGTKDDCYTAELVLADGTQVTVKTDEKSDPTGQWVTYTVDEDDVYSLTNKTSFGAGNSANLTLTNGKSEISFNGQTYYANNNTVFVVYDQTEDEYTSYTGINNVPTITATASAGMAGVKNSNGILTYAFITTAGSNISASTSDVIYIVASSKSNLITDELGEYYEYNALVDGKITTLKVKSDVTITTDEIVKGVTTNTKGLVTALGSDVSVSTATGTKRVSGGTVGLGNKYYTYADDVAVYMIEDDELVASSINAIKNDTNDKVTFVLDEDVVTDIFVTVVDGTNQAAQLNSELSTAIAEFTPKAGSGLESVAMSGNTITLDASKDINDSDIVDSMTDLAANIASVKISGLNSGNAYDNVAAAANALKGDINGKIPEATTSAQTGSAKYTITLAMKDDSTVIYTVVVNWNVAATEA